MLGRIFDISSETDLLFRFSTLGKNNRYFFAFRLDISSLPHFEQEADISYLYRIKIDKKRYFFDKRLAINAFHA